MAARVLDGDDQVALYYSPVEIPLRKDVTANAEMLQRARQALGEAVFAESRQHLPPEFRDKAETILGTQKASRGLPAAVTHWRADAVCLGSRGLGPIKGLLLGSVANVIVHTVNVPVLVARPSPAKSNQGLHVLLAYDEANADMQAGMLRRVTWPAGSKGSVVAVIDALPGPLPSWMEQRARSADAEALSQVWVNEHQEEKRQLTERLSQFVEQLPEPFHGQAPIVAEGSPAEQIIKTAADCQADIVVVGKTSHGLYQRVVLGTTSETVLHQAPCSVLVVPLRDRP